MAEPPPRSESLPLIFFLTARALAVLIFAAEFAPCTGLYEASLWQCAPALSVVMIRVSEDALCPGHIFTEGLQLGFCQAPYSCALIYLRYRHMSTGAKLLEPMQATDQRTGRKA